MRGLRGLGIQGLANPVFSAGCPGGVNLAGTILSYNPIAYWPLNELAGATAVNYGSIGAAGNGTYTGVDLAQIAAPGGGLAPLWSGADICNIYSAALNAAFNGQLGSMSIWWKVLNAGVWTDATNRIMFMLSPDGANKVSLDKPATDNTVDTLYVAGGTPAVGLGTTAYNNTNWNCSTCTFSKVANAVIFYVNGTPVATSVILGTYVGALSAVRCSIGALTPAAPVAPWSGYLAQCAVWNSVLTPAQVTSIYLAGGV